MLRAVVGVIARDIAGGPHGRSQRKHDPPPQQVSLLRRRSVARDTAAEDEVRDQRDRRQPAERAQAKALMLAGVVPCRSRRFLASRSTRTQSSAMMSPCTLT